MDDHVAGKSGFLLERNFRQRPTSEQMMMTGQTIMDATSLVEHATTGMLYSSVIGPAKCLAGACVNSGR
ncbi:hypothetical protein AKJ16_DCAP13963 [Drosera capensis]